MQVQSVGHLVYVEEDTVFTVIRGEWTQSDLERAIPLAEQITSTYGYLFTIAVVAQMSSATPEARRLASEWGRSQNVAGVAVVGAGMTARTVLTLLLRLMFLVRGERFPFTFVATEQEARSWVAAQRAARAHRR